jgi:hypothetical protein
MELRIVKADRAGHFLSDYESCGLARYRNRQNT